MPPTDVVGRRVAQYLLDVLVVSLVTAALVVVGFALSPATLSDATDVSEAAVALVVLGVVLVGVAFGVWYWVFRPASHDGQTLGMAVLGVRVVDERGGPASKGQLAARWVLLVVDGQISGLVGLIVMMVSTRNQRVGDMVARTLVVDAARYPARPGTA